ncbi:MAG: hypothetical protein AB7F21_13165 [Desulfuromonadales bacterium]
MALRFDGKVIEIAESVATLINVNGSSVYIANAVKDYDSQDPLDQASAIVSTMAIVENFASLIKDTKKVGGPLVATSLYLDLATIKRDLDVCVKPFTCYQSKRSRHSWSNAIHQLSRLLASRIGDSRLSDYVRIA